MPTKTKRQPNTQRKKSKRSTRQAKKPKMMSELEIHKKLVEYLKKLQKIHNFMFFHVKNEHSRSDRLRYYWSEQMGVLKGVPDFVFILPCGDVSFLEIKSEKGRMSDHQKTFFDHAMDLEHDVNVAYGWKECVSTALDIIS